MPAVPQFLLRWITRPIAFAILVSVPMANAFEARLTASGAPDDLVASLRAGSLLLETASDKTPDPLDIVAAARADYRRLLSLLYNQGYFGPDISIKIDGREAATLPPFTEQARIASAVITIDPGPRFAFSTARIAPLAPNTALPEGFATGQPARAEIIRETARKGIEGWRATGHAKARIADQSLVADHAAATLAADLRVEAGPELQFGALVLNGKTSVRERRLRKIIALPSGERFDPSTLDTIASRLRRTGVFRTVNIRESDNINPDQSMDIAVNVVDAKPRRVGFGGELQSTDGLSLSAFWMHRNLLGGAERLRIEGEVSGLLAQSGGVDYLLSTELIRPATLGADTDLRFELTAERSNEPLYLQDKIALDIGFTRIHSKTLTTSFGLSLEANKVDDDFGSRDFQMYGLPLGATLDRRDDPLDARTGFYFDLTAMPYLGGGSADSGLALGADARFYRPLGDRLTAAFRLQLGSVLGSSLANTSPDLLFLSGGGGTVRGQPFQSNYITTGGNKSGGLSFLGLSGELRMKAWDDFSAVVFYDAGYIGETSSFGGAGNWHSGAGIGLRYHTGIGPIRVDLAGPVSGANSDGIQLYVGIGQAF